MKITEKYVFFRGGWPSNWYKCSFVLWNIKFSSSEQALMYKKAILFGDEAGAREILSTEDPSVQKAAGHRIKNFQYEVWSEIRFAVMTEILNQKFDDTCLKEKLLSTGERIIVEASPEDIIWGVGLGEDDPDILDEKKWRGLNLLGKALMDVRELKKQQI